MVRPFGLFWLFLVLSLVYQAAFAGPLLAANNPYQSESENYVASIPGPAQRIWDDYVFNTLATDDYQPGCEPMQHRPTVDTPYRGVIILLHGFTSCPKQFSAMAGEFTARGYHVLVPVLPGHGRAGPDELAEQTFLPSSGNWYVYNSFANWLNSLAKAVGGGEIHIGGLCLGGTIATRAMEMEPNLYSRAVLFSPFFEVSHVFLGRIGRLLGRIGDVVKIDSGMNVPFALQDLQICEDVERKQLGRAGYCRVRIGHLVAVARFAKFTLDNMRGLNTQVQTILVENDPVAHPLTTLKMLESKGLAGPHREAACVMKESASHSMFSPTDLPFPKPWLPDLHRELGEFLGDGKAMILAHSSRYAWPQSQGSVSSCAVWP